MSKNNGNFIRPGKHGSQVVLDPDFLLCHALYMPDGQTVVKSNMTVGQATEISVTNYVYKFVVAVLITPVLYVVHAAVKGWLGRDAAESLAHEAHPRDPA